MIAIALENIGRDILKAVADEPEYPGEMPDEMWAAIKDDRDAATKALQITVRLTKRGIRDRILLLK
jgi:hypothetical protein